jgi:hypothetical protein
MCSLFFIDVTRQPPVLAGRQSRSVAGLISDDVF